MHQLPPSPDINIISMSRLSEPDNRIGIFATKEDDVLLKGKDLIVEYHDASSNKTRRVSFSKLVHALATLLALEDE